MELVISAWSFPGLFIIMVSTFNLVLMTLEKLWAITAPLHYIAQASGRRINVMILLSWLVSFLIIFCCIVFLIWRALGVSDIIIFNRRVVVKIAAYMIIVANIVFVVSYCVIFWTINRRQRHGLTPCTVKMRTVILCICVVLSLSISTTPFVVAHVVTWTSPPRLVHAGNSLIAVNSATNSIVFLASYYCYNRSKRIKRGNIASADAQ